MLERIGVFTTIVFVIFIYTSKAQNFNDTIYFDARDQLLPETKSTQLSVN